MLMVHSAMAAMTGAGDSSDVYRGADIVLDFAGVKNGGIPLYRVDGVVYPSAEAAGFPGTGTFDSNGYTPGTGACIAKTITYGSDLCVHVRFDDPGAAGIVGKRVANLSVGGTARDRVFIGQMIDSKTVYQTSYVPTGRGGPRDRATFGINNTFGFAHFSPSPIEVSSFVNLAATGIFSVGGSSTFMGDNWQRAIKLVTVHLTPLTLDEVAALSL